MIRFIVNALSYEVGWAACIAGAATGRPWLGPVVVGLLLALHLSVVKPGRREAIAVGVVTLLGSAVDTALLLTGVLTFGEPGAGFPIWFLPWIAALWVNYAVLLSVALRWFRKRLVLAGVLGAVFGPLAYYAGARLGALGLHDNLPLALGVLAVEWAIAAPLTIWLAARIHGEAPNEIHAGGAADDPG